MTEKTKWQKQSEKWMEKAQRNLSDAKLLFREGGFADTICFLCQQATEKSLKGLLVSRGMEINNRYKIHDLVQLINFCEKYISDLSETKKEAAVLNRYYIETRYPVEISQEYSRKEIQGALDIAEKIFRLIRKFLSQL